MSNIIEQVGIPTNTNDFGYKAYQDVLTFASQMLVPELIGTSKVSVSASSNAENIIRATGSNAELTGLKAFLSYLSNNKLPISNPSDVWKYATFITYIADSRDISALNISNTDNLIISNSAFSTLTNLLQSATYTITTFSGECSAYARLYAATQTILNTSSSALFYNVFYTGNSASPVGHVTDLWTPDGTTWHISNYMIELIGDNPWNLIAYLWQNIYNMNLDDYAVTVTQNIYYDPALTQNEFVKVIASQSFSKLASLNILQSNNQIQVINHETSTEYSTYSKDVATLMQIISYASPSSDDLSKYLPYIIGGGLALLLLSQL